MDSCANCPVGWHTDDAPRRHRVRGRVRGRGSRPVLAQNQGVRVPIPAGVFYAPQKHAPGFFSVAKNCVFKGKPRECVSPFPQGLFMPSKTRPSVFAAAKMLFGLGNHTLFAPILTYVGIGPIKLSFCSQNNILAAGKKRGACFRGQKKPLREWGHALPRFPHKNRCF